MESEVKRVGGVLVSSKFETLLDIICIGTVY